MTGCSQAPVDSNIAAEASAQTIYLVRHAEKLTGDDPALTPQGHERAQALRDWLLDKNIEAIYSSDFVRTQQTAAPLANALGLTVRAYDPSKLEALVMEITDFGQTALVVGHSNTTPPLAEIFGAPSFGPIIEATEYDRLYEIVRVDDSTAADLHRYGAPSQ